MKAPRVLLVSLVATAAGFAVGRAGPRAPSSAARSLPPAIQVAAIPDHACRTERAELATVRAQLGICMAYASPLTEPAPVPGEVPGAPDERAGMEAILAELPAIRAERERAPELVEVRTRDGRIRSYRPDEWPPDRGDLEGARITRRKLADGTWEVYDPSPDVVRLAGPPGPDGLVTLPDGTRVRWVSTDAGAP